MRRWIEFFLTFVKIGCLTLGGGYVMIPLIYHECVEQHHWLDRETFFGGTSLAQGAPGANAVNTAVFVGYQWGGVAGSAVAAIGCIIPSLLIITVLGPLIFRLIKLPIGVKIFGGLRAGVVGLLAYFLITWMRPLRHDYRGWVLLLLTLAALLRFQQHPIPVMAVAATLGYLLAGKRELSDRDGEQEC